MLRKAMTPGGAPAQAGVQGRTSRAIILGLRLRRGTALLLLPLAACATTNATGPATPSVAPPAASPPAGMQWLYGSGEGAALVTQSYRALVAFATARKGGGDSVVLADGAPLAGGPTAAVRFQPCGDKPRAVVFDADETLLWNVGFEYWAARTGRGYDRAVWTDWERTGHPVAMPGAVEALARLRAAGITPVVNTNRSSASAAQTAAALEAAGLGHFVHGDTLLLQGDDDAGSGKDKRRATIAARYCVVAMAGDNLGDFSDQFNAKDVPVAQRRDLAAAQGIEGSVSALWGRGWFLMPNPVYGPSIAGDIDTIFPPEWRWMPTQGEQ